MYISLLVTKSKKIDCLRIDVSIIGNISIGFEGYFSKCLDTGRFYQLIDFKEIQIIGYMGIQALCDFADRGIDIRLFNVKPEIEMMIKALGKDDVIQIYNEVEVDKAVKMFEEDLTGGDMKVEEKIKNRSHVRVETNIDAIFKYNSSGNRVISGRTRVVNLSEGGLLGDNIEAVYVENNERIGEPKILGEKLYDIKFKLDGEPDIIKVNGECVRKLKANGRECAGVMFENIDKKNRLLVQGLVSYIYLDTWRPDIQGIV